MHIRQAHVVAIVTESQLLAVPIDAGVQRNRMLLESSLISPRTAESWPKCPALRLLVGIVEPL